MKILKYNYFLKESDKIPADEGEAVEKPKKDPKILKAEEMLKKLKYKPSSRSKKYKIKEDGDDEVNDINQLSLDFGEEEEDKKVKKHTFLSPGDEEYGWGDEKYTGRDYYSKIYGKKAQDDDEKDAVRMPTPIEAGDYVKIIDTKDLNDNQLEFLHDRPILYVKDIVNKKGLPYRVGEPHIDVGYKIPLKMSRFVKADKADSKYKVLFLQFDLPIDLHGEKDKEDFFKGAKTMSSIFTKLFHEKLGDSVFVTFNNYDDIHKIKSDYYINNIALKNYDFVFFW